MWSVPCAGHWAPGGPVILPGRTATEGWGQAGNRVRRRPKPASERGLCNCGPVACRAVLRPGLLRERPSARGFLSMSSSQPFSTHGCRASGARGGQAALRGGAAGRISPSGNPWSRSGTWLSLCQWSRGALCTRLCASCCHCWRAGQGTGRLRPGQPGQGRRGPGRTRAVELSKPKSKVLASGSRAPGTPPAHWPWPGSDLRPRSASPVPPLAQQRPPAGSPPGFPAVVVHSSSGGCLVAVRFLGQDLGPPGSSLSSLLTC